MAKKVFVGLSGGVDSSVTAALLKERGYEVVGVYMKNWSQDLPGFPCPWKDDYQDAKRVAVALGIDFKMYDFESDYRQKVVDYMINEYQSGRTPNPDVMCNQEIKFKLFLESALEDGADIISTGHYSKIKDGKLHMAENPEKDQTYFLYRVSEAALRRSLMPIGDIATKSEVRQIAKRFQLPTAEKKDSQGICFVGKVGIRDFLAQYVAAEPGPIIDQYDKIIGEHDGAIFYTIGQRHGLDIGGGLPYYVIGKDMPKNEVYVTTRLDDEKLWRTDFQISDVHWINGKPADSARLHARVRYRAKLIPCDITESNASTASVRLTDQVRAITPGQSAVIYEGTRVAGGGIVV